MCHYLFLDKNRQLFIVRVDDYTVDETARFV